VGLPIFVVLCVYLGIHLMGRFLQWGWIPVLGQGLVAFAWYRVALASVHHVVITAASAGPSQVSSELSKRILNSLRAAGLYAVVTVISLLVTRALFGRGYVDSIITNITILGGALVAWLLLRHWRADAFKAYSKIYPKGRLASVVQTARDRWWGIALLVPTLGRLAIRAVVILVQDTALKFDRTRRALAYLFRRQLERGSKALRLSATDRWTLPAKLREAFTTIECAGDVRVDHFPYLDEVMDHIAARRAEKRGTSVALVGERGIGKATWLAELSRRIDARCIHATMDETLVTGESVCRTLSRLLEVPEHSTVDGLVAEMAKIPPTHLLLDQCQNLVLRSVGGMKGLDTFAQVVRRTMGRHVFVCSFSRYAWEHVEFVLQGQIFFLRVHILPGWSEERIRDLVERRMKACGMRAVYDDLLQVGTGSAGAIDIVKDRYFRLLWDYADGIPRLATHYWMRSLSVEGDVARVRLFESLVPDTLESLEEQSKFVLLGVVSQENLTVDEAIMVLGFTREQCVSQLELLRALGYLKKYNDRYRVTLTWDRAAVRYLRRKHLLYT
jgi:hypothetical protein